VLFRSAVGARLGQKQNYSILLGQTEQTTQENGPISTQRGDFIQIGVNQKTEKDDYDFLSSYSTIENFSWSRFRYKRKISSSYSAGTELFLMGNTKASSGGLGVIIDHNLRFSNNYSINVGAKFGIKQATNDESSIYGGLELSLPFP